MASCCTGYRALSIKNKKYQFIVQVSVMGLLQILSIVVCYVFVKKQKKNSEKTIKKIQDLEAANLCSDEYNQIPLTALSNQMNNLSVVMDNLKPISLAMIVMIALNIGVILLVCAKWVPSEGDIDFESDDETADADEPILPPVRPSAKKKEPSEDEVEQYMSERRYLQAIVQY
jgi:hypothetical protein